MQPDSLQDAASAGGKQVILPSAASSGGFVQMRTAPAPCPVYDDCFGQVTATTEATATAGEAGEANHAR